MFLDEAQAILQKTLPEIQQQIEDYVPRVLVREGVSREEAAEWRPWIRSELPETQSKFLDDSGVVTRSRLVIIGDAGSGKSYILQNAYLEATATFLDSAYTPIPFFLDLSKQLSRRHSIREALDYWYERLFSQASSEHEPGCALFLDALDERLLTEANPHDFITELLIFLRDHKDQLSNVILACRRAVWRPNWFSSWDVYHADYLDREDYAAIISDSASQREFFNHTASLGISDLLRLPFIGFDLARRYSEGHRLPSNRREWFHERIRRSLKGTRRDQERGHSPSLDTLLVLARQLASLAVLGKAPSWSTQEAVDQLGGSRALSEALGSITYEQIEVLFQRPLFTKLGDRFSFSHQLFSEYLAAEALSSTPLRKQRQLLSAADPALRHRILTPYRGIAVFLAEMSSEFRDYLIETDPLVAFLAELPDLPPEADEQLTTAIIDSSIAERRAYWWGVPPRGERPDKVLPKHRPRDIASFVRPYLQRSDEMSLLWATACVNAWGGSVEINGLLVDLAHDDKLHVETRKNAIYAILATGEKKNICKLYDLLDTKDDQVRGHVLRAYRKTESPTPTDYIVKLRGGAHNDNLLSVLQIEARRFGSSYDQRELQEAFQEVNSRFEEFGNLRSDVISGLLLRAVELNFDDIPPSLVVKLWQSRDVGEAYYEEQLKKLMSDSWDLVARVWNYVMAELRQQPRKFLPSELDRYLAQVCDDRIFNLLPADASDLNRVQERLIQQVLHRYFAEAPTIARLQEFRQRAPAFTTHFRSAQSIPKSSARDPMESRSEVVSILNREGLEPCVQTFQIMGIVAETLYGDTRASVRVSEIVEFLKELSAPLLKRVLEVFEACVFEVGYSRIQADEPDNFTITQPKYALPFWILWTLGAEFPADKLDEFIRCYAFLPLSVVSGGATIGDGPESFFPLLDKLHDSGLGRWTETVRWLADFSLTTTGALEYLMERESDLYVQHCRQRLCECDFGTADFSALVDYWLARRPSDYKKTLHACYRCVDSEDHRTEILYRLLVEDDDWAWDELGRRVKAENPPRGTAHITRHGILQLPLNPSRLPVLADWCAAVRRDQRDGVWSSKIGSGLEEVIVRIGGDDAIKQLRRLQEEKAFPGAEWLSYQILRIEDQMLSVPGTTMDSHQLLDFVNREAFGIVFSERDLFEWTCQAIEDVKEGAEKRAEQVHGYWNRHNEQWEPATEPECQNVLWPRIRDRLSHLGIVGIEEKQIRADRADFWIEKPGEMSQPLHVAVELKVARKYYGRSRLIAPIGTQLYEQYLYPSGCRHGIYAVLWFKDNERYPYPTGWATPEELMEELNHCKREVMNEHHVDLACYVIDMTTPARLR